MRCEERRRDVEPARRRQPALEFVGRDEGQVGPQLSFGDAVGAERGTAAADPGLGAEGAGSERGACGERHDEQRTRERAKRAVTSRLYRGGGARRRRLGPSRPAVLSDASARRPYPLFGSLDRAHRRHRIRYRWPRGRLRAVAGPSRRGVRARAEARRPCAHPRHPGARRRPVAGHGVPGLQRTDLSEFHPSCSRNSACPRTPPTCASA